MWGKSWLGKSVKERRPVETNQFRLNRTGVLLVGNLIFSIRIVHKAKFNPLLSLEYLSFSLSDGSDLAVRHTRSHYQDHRAIFSAQVWGSWVADHRSVFYPSITLP